ncbi:MAG: hypothetical protein AB8H79_06865 [Myxococcota bacterium]
MRTLTGWVLLSTAVTMGGCVDDPAPSPCADEARGEVLSVDTRFEGDTTATVSNMDPSPPQVGLNQWTIQTPGDMAGCTLVAEPFMPDHGHGASVGGATEMGQGEWQIEDLRFSMGGYWEVSLTWDCDGSEKQVVMPLCVEA